MEKIFRNASYCTALRNRLSAHSGWAKGASFHQLGADDKACMSRLARARVPARFVITPGFNPALGTPRSQSISNHEHELKAPASLGHTVRVCGCALAL